MNDIVSSKLYSVQAEQATLGGLLIDNSKFSEVKKILSASNFFLDKHQKIYIAITELIKKNNPCDVITLSEYLHNQNVFDEQEGQIISYLAELSINTPSAANIKHYSKIVKEKSTRRKLANIGESITNAASEETIEFNILLQSKLDELRELESTNLEKPGNKLNKVALPDFLRLELPPRELILSPWLSRQSLSMIYAPRGLGKTHVSLGIAYAIASGSNFLNWHSNKPRGVLFIDGELPAYELQERLANIIFSNEKLPAAPLEIITPDLQPYGMPDLSTQEGQQLINQNITDQIDVIILDNLATLVRSGKENEGESWQPIQNWGLDLRSKGKSVLFIHHSGKTGQQRGTSRREDVLDTVIALRKSEDYSPENGACFEIHFEKARGFCGDAAKPFNAQLTLDATNKQSWLIKSLEHSTFEKVVDLFNEGLTQKEISEELNIGKSTISKYVARAKEQGLINQKGNTHDHSKNSFTVSSYRE